MPKDFPTKAKLCFQIGAVGGLATGILMPYHAAFCFLMICVCLLWLAGCQFCRSVRGEFAAARKYLILAVLLVGLDCFLSDGPISALLLFAACMLLYFSAALQCGGIAALAEQCAPDSRACTLPGAVTRFEHTMIVFAGAQLIGSNMPSLALICDLAGMAALMFGFFTLWRYFSGKEDAA